MNNIVIFGCDNSGKSTLVNNLLYYIENELNIECSSIHSPGPVSIEDMKKFMETNLIDKTENPNKIKIFDRFPIIEEAVYGPILRNKNRFDDLDYNKTLLDKVDLFILCDPGPFNIMKWDNREQYPGVKENAFEIILEYYRIAYSLMQEGYKVKTYNYHLDYIEDLL